MAAGERRRAGLEKTLVVKGRAGMGNRILAALTGIVYARASGRRLVVDWRDRTYSDDGTNAFHRLFGCTSCAEGSEIPETDSVRPGVWRGHLSESVVSLQKARGEPDWQKFRRVSAAPLTRVDYREEVVVFWAFTPELHAFRPYLRGELVPLRKLSTDAILRRLLETDLTPHPDVRERVDRFWLASLRPGAIGVHVRYSDRRGYLDGTVAEVDALLSAGPGSPPILLATDNAEIETLFSSRYPEVVSAPRWYPEPGVRMHQNPDCPDRLANGLEALTDLYLLARCDRLVLDTRSSFARVASLLVRGPVTDVRGGEEPPPTLAEQAIRLGRRRGGDALGAMRTARAVLRRPGRPAG